MINGIYNSFLDSPFSFMGEQTLANALFKNDLELASKLLETGFRFNWTDLVASLNNPSMHQLFLQHAHNLFECDLCFQIKLPLLTEETQRLLLSLFAQEKFDINLCDEEGTPLLHLLVRSKNLTLLKGCLNHGKLDKKISDARGIKTLQLAAGQGNTEVVSLLLQAGFDINEEVPMHLSPLHIAADRGDENMVALLLKYGANPNCKSDSELLPLHHALMHTGYQTNLISMLHTHEEFTPSHITILHKEGGHIFARSLYKKLDDKYKWNTREMNIITLCGNLFELKGFSEMRLRTERQNAQKIRLEGLRSDRIVHRQIIKHLTRLKKDPSFPKSIRTLLIDTSQFSELSSYMSNSIFLERFHEGKPLMVRTGYLRHAVQFIFLKVDENRALFGVCNGHHPLQLFWFEPAKLSEKMVAECRITMRTISSYKSLLLSFKEKLGQIDSFTLNIEKHYPLPKQKSGNCVVASINAALWTLIACSFGQENKSPTLATELFHCLDLDLKLHFVTKYFNSHLKKNNPYLPDISLCHTLFEKLGPYKFLLGTQYKELVEKFPPLPLIESEKIEPISEEKDLNLQILRERYYP